MPMMPSKVFLLLEPSVMIPSWFSQSIEGLKEAAAKQKKTLQMVDSPEQIEEGAVSAILIGTNNEWTREAVNKCRRRGIRPILIGSNPTKFGEDISGTVYGGKSSIEELLRYFASCGRKRVALLGINAKGSNDLGKRTAFLTLAESMNLPITAADVYYKGCDSNSDSPSEAFFDAIDRYDGVICSNDYVAAFVLRYTAEHGIKVPEQLFVSGLGDSPLCRYTTPSLTSATRSYRKTGEQAFNIWKQLTNDPDIFSVIVTVRCEIKPRESTANAPLPAREASILPANHAPSLPANAVAAADNAVRRLEYCLAQCDHTDIRIVQGMLAGVSAEAMAEQLFLSSGTVRYRLKKMYEAANVSTKSDFIELFNHYIRKDTFFKDYLEDDSELKKSI